MKILNFPPCFAQEGKWSDQEYGEGGKLSVLGMVDPWIEFKGKDAKR